MNLIQLQTFLAVCRTMSFTEASRQMCISQPAVSRQMSTLEEEIGTRLFVRDHSTITLTMAGQHFYDKLAPQVTSLQKLIGETKRIGDGEKGSLRIGLLEDQSLDSRISTPLRELREKNVYLSIQRLNFQELEQKLASSDIDLAISIAQSPDVFPGCCRKIYAVEDMCLAVHRDYLDMCQNVRSGEDLMTFSKSCPILMPSLDSFQRSQYEKLQSVTRSHWYGGQEYDFSSIAPMVASGLAASIVNESHNLSVDQSVVLMPLGDIPGVEKGIFWLEKNRNPMIDQLLERFRS